MTCAATTILLALLTILNYFLGKRRILYPPLIYSSVWFADCALFWSAPIEANAVHSITWWMIALGALAFSVGGWLSKYLPQSVFKTRLRIFVHPTSSSFARIVLLALSVACVPILLYSILAHGGGGGLYQVIQNARDYQVAMGREGQSEASFLANLPPYSIFVSLICLIERRDWIFWTSFAIAVLCSVESTGRTFILMLFASLIAVQLIKSNQDNLKGLLKIGGIPILAFSALFIGLAFVTKDVSGFAGNNGAIISNFVLAYVIMPIPALDYVLTHAANYAHAPQHTFLLLSLILNLFGFSIPTPPVLDDFILVPLPTNVYTVYKFYFTDFGLIGALIAILTIGIVQTAIYRRAKNGGKLSLMICAVLVFPALLSIFDDAYSGSLLLVIKLCALGFLYWGALNRVNWGFQLPRLRPGLWATAKRETT